MSPRELELYEIMRKIENDTDIREYIDLQKPYIEIIQKFNSIDKFVSGIKGHRVALINLNLQPHGFYAVAWATEDSSQDGFFPNYFKLKDNDTRYSFNSEELPVKPIYIGELFPDLTAEYVLSQLYKFMNKDIKAIAAKNKVKEFSRTRIQR